MGIQNLESIYKNLDSINITKNKNLTINLLQKINNDISVFFKSFGTDKFEDLITVCFGQTYLDYLNKSNNEKFIVLKEHFHPIGYKVMTWKNKQPKEEILFKNQKIEDCMLIDKGKTLDCFNLARTSNSFHTKVYGIKIVLKNYEKKKYFNCLWNN